MSENATNGYEWRNKTLCYSELPTTHVTNTVTEKRLRRSSPFCVPTPDSSPTNFETKKLRTMKSTFSVIYYLKRQVVKKDGTVPVMGRITVDGSQTQFSCKLTVDPKLWDTKGGRVTGRSAAALETNRMLDKMRVRINRHYQEIMERDNFVTAEKVKNAFLGLEHRYHTLMQVYRRHNEDYEKQVEAGMKAKGTLEKYRIVYKHLQEFLDIRYHVKDIALKELTPAFISDFEMFLRTDKHCCTNTVWLYVCPLRTMVFIAINNEWLTRDPFREYEIKKEETTRSFLTKDEIRLLMEGKLKNAKQELYRDLYLFCAFTGLSFADMRNLTEENIRTYFDEHEWININRKKTGVVSNIRLLDIANRIIGKYRGLCENGRIFPVPHYNTCLAGIRAVAKRDIIIIEDKAVSVTGNDVWMTATEIAGLFHTTVPAVNAVIKAVRKSDVLNDYKVCRYMQLENGLYADVYAPEIIILIAFRLNTYNTYLFRMWLVGKVLSQEKRQTYVMFIQNGKTAYC